MSNQHKFDAIVLSAVDQKDYDKVLTIFSSQYGKQKVLLRGCKRPQAKMRFVGQPFFFGEFVIVDGKGYDVITQAVEKKNFMSIVYDYTAYQNAGMALRSIALTSLSQKCERQFLLLLTYLTVLQQNMMYTNMLTSKFYVELLKILGFEINTDFCQNCGKEFKGKMYFDKNQNCIVCSQCNSYDNVSISEKDLKAIKLLKDNKFLKLLSLQLCDKEYERLAKIFQNSIERLCQ